MGHERVGSLPRSARWLAVVGRIAGAEVSPEEATELADATLTNVRRRFEQLADEETVQAAFRFLVALPLATRSSDPSATLLSGCGVGIGASPSPLALTKAFQASLEQLPHSERSDLAAKALADALSQYALDLYWFTGKLTKRVEGKGGAQLSTGGLQGV